MVHLGSFLLAIVSKNVHFSHYCVSRVSWAPVESARVHTNMGVACCLVLEFIKGPCFQGVYSRKEKYSNAFSMNLKQQKHQTTEGFPRFSIETFPSFYAMNPETDLRLMDS